jgi:hypothetical protein
LPVNTSVSQGVTILQGAINQQLFPTSGTAAPSVVVKGTADGEYVCYNRKLWQMRLRMWQISVRWSARLMRPQRVRRPVWWRRPNVGGSGGSAAPVTPPAAGLPPSSA